MFIALYPIDTVKTRLQLATTGGGIRALFKAGGGKALYAGAFARSHRALSPPPPPFPPLPGCKYAAYRVQLLLLSLCWQIMAFN